MKKVKWEAPKIAPKLTQNKLTIKDVFQKMEIRRKEQEARQAFLQKAMPAMLKLLELKLQKGEYLTVMMPLQYEADEYSVPNQGDEIEKSFYRGSKTQDESALKGSYQPVIKTIYPGTRLFFKGMDAGLQQFLFEDAEKTEHAISYNQKLQLLTQTDIYDTVSKYFAEGTLK